MLLKRRILGAISLPVAIMALGLAGLSFAHAQGRGIEGVKVTDCDRPGTTFKDCPDCPEMVVVPAGRFRMGDLNSNERPVHRVTIPRAFAVGKYEVTQAEWRALMGANPSRFKGERNPVEQVSWKDTKEFVRRLSARTGKQYRLLSEAEWEYAARAGTKTKYPWGNSISPSQANYRGSKGNPVSVGSYPRNGFGLHDMHGNVWEWVEDCWNKSYGNAPADGSAWTSGNCSHRILRGGSWNYPPRLLHSASRIKYSAGDRIFNGGFRVARTLDR